jgi:adenylate cyclase class 1
VPVDSIDNRYNETLGLISDVNSGVDPDDFIDLGDITEIPRYELLAASLWQMHKALSDPMKSVLKMAQIRMYLEEKSTPTLICNIIKKRIHELKPDDVIDPYIETFRIIEQHYIKESETQTSDFLRKCMYIKASPAISARDLVMFDRHDKKALVSSIIRQWGWSIKALEMLNAFSKWDIKTYKKFGADIHGFLSSSATALLKSASTSDQDSGMKQDFEIEVLRRRIESVYVRKEDKVESEKRVIKMESAYEDLYFNFRGGKWQVFNSSDGNEKTGIITSSSRIASIIAWLVFNRRFGTSTSCHMMPNASNVFLSDVQNLMKELNSIIPGARMLGLEREALLKPISIERLVLIGNLEQPSSSGLMEIDVVALNSWKELYSMRMEKEEVRVWFSNAGSKQTKISVWTPGGSDSRSLALELISLVRIR